MRVKYLQLFYDFNFICRFFLTVSNFNFLNFFYRFRTCLKMADSADANMVGKLFFNIVQTKCFVLKREMICKKRSKHGDCMKKGLRKRAHIRDNRKW